MLILTSLGISMHFLVFFGVVNFFFKEELIGGVRIMNVSCYGIKFNDSLQKFRYITLFCFLLRALHVKAGFIYI
jgi:hypothetical protein